MTESERGDAPVSTLGGFTLRRGIASQGCHAVYQGEDSSGGLVAIRAVCLDAHEDLRQRLDTELVSLTRLAGAGPAPAVIADGQNAKLQYLVTQWLPGQTWRAYRKMPDVEVHRLFAGAASALAALHRGGVAHGDLSDNNIVVDDDYTVRFVDFESSVVPDAPPPSGVFPHGSPGGSLRRSSSLPR
ncbi:phosphotransferase [Streptomyces sp. G1]|uniref:phosphotransferase n=1 Tax=Streptomyces sp. G1 TaxID=361572 RepID=UPI00202E45F5|nr:phosphotransferase [Streptomyces sp. G1]MCM1972989.1 phosphotransferase [Streptomyces sp. G1]